MLSAALTLLRLQGATADLTPGLSVDNAESNYSGVVGAIAGAGKIEVHADGFRSSEAQVLALLLTNKFDLKHYQVIAEKYNIKLFTNQENFLEFAQTHARSKDEIDELVEHKEIDSKLSSSLSTNRPRATAWQSFRLGFILNFLPCFLGFVLLWLIKDSAAENLGFCIWFVLLASGYLSTGYAFLYSVVKRPVKFSEYFVLKYLFAGTIIVLTVFSIVSVIVFYPIIQDNKAKKIAAEEAKVFKT